MKLSMTLLKGSLGVCSLSKDDPIPQWALQGDYFSVTKTIDELSIVCPVGVIPEGVICEKPWRALKVEGPLDLTLIGILANLSRILSEAGVSIFSISTYDTDYILVKEQHTDYAVKALENEGIKVKNLDA